MSNEAKAFNKINELYLAYEIATDKFNKAADEMQPHRVLHGLMDDMNDALARYEAAKEMYELLTGSVVR
jgi:hypothetical protein